MAEHLRIARLGHRGDGVGDIEGRTVFVAHALPGELVEVERSGSDRARLLRVLESSPDRVAQFRADIAVCGGCGLRHISVPAQLSWKRDLVIENLRGAGLNPEVGSCVDAHGEGRRRATFHARLGSDGVLRVGFTEARSHDVIDLGEHDCAVLSPALKAAVEPVRALARTVQDIRKPLDVVATATRNGLDVDLRGLGKLAEKLRLRLVETAGRLGIARLAVHGEALVEVIPPVTSFDGVDVTIPPGGFLQATQAGEDVLGGLVVQGVGEARKVADLFAGSGTFSLRLARHAAVLAVESDRAALSALDRAARRASGLRPVSVEARDLYRRPLQAAELKGFDAVVFDPPRAGADIQARAIAVAGPKRVVAVSCNPGTLARDLAILVEGGYRIEAVTPVDQFRHSAHVEAVAVLSRS
jgi:23S rRNA (uracil1939-C5)-methyltransferase